jgi:mannose-6-phosphate isomerase-like protein (cupin superfamily)
MQHPSDAELPPIERVVTGHRPDGTACVASKGPLPSVHRFDAVPGTVFHEVWSTSSTPSPIDNGDDPTLGALALAPPRHGTRVRFVDIPPDSEDFLAHGAASMKAAFASIGDEKASTVRANSPHPLMHRTETVDYGILIEGELILVLDDEEVVLRPGSVVVQRGTNHAWANRSGRPARMLFVLIDGVFAPEIASSLKEH